MNHKLLALLFCSFCLSAICQTKNSSYNQSLADSLGSDEYGMKTYIFVILKTGSAKIEDKKTLDSLFKGHMENIGSLVNKGKLIVAGPLIKNDKSYRGIFILNVKTIEEANTLLQTDPTIQQKVLEAEVFKWYGSAALPMYLPFHDKIQKKKI